MTARTSSPGAIDSVAIIGAGTMGAQIGALVAFSGRRTTIYDTLPDALVRAEQRIEQGILPSISAGGQIDGDVAAARNRITFIPTLSDAVQDVDLVIEAVREDLEVKREVFAELSELAPNAILATNSSSIRCADFAGAVADPSRLLNMHFFAPIWVRTMLELMSSGSTTEAILERTFAFGRSLGLVTAVLRTQSKGFIINRIWRSVRRECLRVVDEGVATPEEIDRFWMIFFQTKFAPFGTMDMVGLDVSRDIEWSYQRETLDPTDLPSATLARLVEEGHLGEKTGRGFYSYPNPAYAQPGFVHGED
jgi:3-hydroxybutyryl-CoA dehydrogenase